MIGAALWLAACSAPPETLDEAVELAWDALASEDDDGRLDEILYDLTVLAAEEPGELTWSPDGVSGEAVSAVRVNLTPCSQWDGVALHTHPDQGTIRPGRSISVERDYGDGASTWGSAEGRSLSWSERVVRPYAGGQATLLREGIARCTSPVTCSSAATRLLQTAPAQVDGAEALWEDGATLDLWLNSWSFAVEKVHVQIAWRSGRTHPLSDNTSLQALLEAELRRDARRDDWWCAGARLYDLE